MLVVLLRKQSIPEENSLTNCQTNLICPFNIALFFSDNFDSKKAMWNGCSIQTIGVIQPNMIKIQFHLKSCVYS